MKNIKISVIVPVYNTENYLEQCLNSLINQTLEDIEIICINDGSTDKSLEILEKYAKRDNRIIIIDQENQGAGAARNNGMSLANGEYIGFIDSDDWIDESTYEILYSKAHLHDLDILMFQMINYDNNTKKLYETNYYNLSCLKEKFDEKIFNHKSISDSLFRTSVGPCTKIYKKDFLKTFNIVFPENVIFEDNPFFYESILRAEKISIYPHHLYYRRRHEVSIISSANKRFIDAIEISNRIINIFIKTGFYEKYAEKLFNNKVNFIINWYKQINPKYKNIYFKLSKEDFLKIKNKENFMENLNSKNSTYFNNILKSSNHKEFDLLNEIYDLKIKNKKIKNENKKLLRESKKLDKKINKMTSSLSWKITKYCRLFF